MTRAALLGALDREWEAQSGRAAPLQSTVPVRTALELVLGLFAAARATGTTPEEVVASVGDELPAELSPWTRRALRRVEALRSAPRLLNAPPAAPEPILMQPADVPQLPPPEPEPPLPVPAPKRSLLARLFRRGPR